MPDAMLVCDDLKEVGADSQYIDAANGLPEADGVDFECARKEFAAKNRCTDVILADNRKFHKKALDKRPFEDKGLEELARTHSLQPDQAQSC